MVPSDLYRQVNIQNKLMMKPQTFFLLFPLLCLFLVTFCKTTFLKGRDKEAKINEGQSVKKLV